jgi:hypothetical protein
MKRFVSLLALTSVAVSGAVSARPIDRGGPCPSLRNCPQARPIRRPVRQHRPIPIAMFWPIRALSR